MDIPALLRALGCHPNDEYTATEYFPTETSLLGARFESYSVDEALGQTFSLALWRYTPEQGNRFFSAFDLEVEPHAGTARSSSIRLSLGGRAVEPEMLPHLIAPLAQSVQTVRKGRIRRLPIIEYCCQAPPPWTGHFCIGARQ